MRIVSIDVGIKNLAICVFSIKYESEGAKIDLLLIDKWDVINLAQKEITKCSGFDSKGNECTNQVQYTKNGICYCLKHSKKEIYYKPAKEFELKYLKKQKVQQLYDIIEKHCIEYDSPVKKADLINIIHTFGQEKCFEPIDKIDANKLDIVTIGRNIQHKLNILFDNFFEDISLVLIENQISPIANRMKTIQGMLSQYFLMKNDTLDVEFISSINKLKDDNLLNSSYSQRKKAGISKCLGIISEDFISWVEFFNKHKKKDDLADCFLQGMWYINNKL